MDRVFAPYEDGQVEYFVSGEKSGKGLVFVHGTGQTAENTWTEVARNFAPTYRVVCPNYSGSGNTTDSGEDLTIELLAYQVLIAADHAGLKQFDIVGHSLGTCVAMYLAANYPYRINKVALLAGFMSTGDARSQLQFKLWKELANTNPHALAELFLFTGFSPRFVGDISNDVAQSLVEKIFSTTDWSGTSRQIDLDLRVNVTKEAQEIEQTVLILECAYDYIISGRHAQKLMKVLSNFRYESILAGHAGCVERCKQFTKILSKFLALKRR